MAEHRDPLAAFDDALLATVATERDVSAPNLGKLLRRHQQRARRLPGVEDLVYQWRSRWPDDPLVVRTDAAYYLAVRATVWERQTDGSTTRT